MALPEYMTPEIQKEHATELAKIMTSGASAREMPAKLAELAKKTGASLGKTKKAQEEAKALDIKRGETEGMIDYSKIARTLKQQQGVTGKALDPEILKTFTAGAIKGQVEPAIQRRERAIEREQQQKQFEETLALKKEALKTEEEAYGAAGKADVFGTVGAGIGLAFGGPAGAAIGAGVGKLLSGASIICTELYNQKLIDKKTYLGAIKYREKYIDNEAYNGYLVWADPVVKLMQRSRLITWLVSLFWIPLTKDMASQIYDTKPNYFGRLMTKIVIPFSRCFNKTKEVSYA
jgi:hypothetical protein